MSNVREIMWAWSSDPAGNPLALVIFNDRSFEYVPHTGFDNG